MAFPTSNPYTQSYGGTMYGGTPFFNSQAMGMTGFPGLGNNPLMQMLMQQLMTQFMGMGGYFPGQFAPIQNVMDQYRSRGIFMQNMLAAQQASMNDQVQQMNLFRGAYTMMGGRFGLDQFIAARGMIQDADPALNMLAMMNPHFYDAMHGARGSERVMASAMHMAGRYNTDPVSGLTGWSGRTAAAITSGVFANLYGPGVDIAPMRGIGAGEMGHIYDEMNRRGFMGVGLDDSDRRGIAAKYGLGAGASKADIDKFLAGNSAAQDEMFKVNATRIADQLKGMAGVVSAMRDIFGDMGKPNAPIPEIINSLQMLTQGGLSTMNRGEMELLVRRTYNLARSSGLGMEGMMNLINAGSGMSDHLGLNRQYAIQSALGATSYAKAFAEIGGATPYWNKPDRDTITVADQQLRLSASASPVGQVLNVAAAIQAKMGGQVTGQAKAFLDAMVRGDTSYKWNGQTHSLAINPSAFIEMMVSGGVDRSIVGGFMASPVGMQQYGIQFGTQDLARRLQLHTDILPGMTGASRFRMDSFLADKVGDASTRSSLALAMSGAAAKAAMSMSPDQFANEAEFEAAMADAMAKASGGRYTADELRKAGLPTLMKATYQQYFAGQGTSFENVRELHQPRLSKRALEYRKEQDAEAQLQSAFSSLGRLQPMRRFVETIMSGGLDTKGFDDLLRETLGGLNLGSLSVAERAALEDPLKQMNSLLKDYYATADPTMKQKKLEQIREQAGIAAGVVGKHYVGGGAVTGAMATDIHKAGLSDKDRGKFVSNIGLFAEMALENEANLRQLGKGSVQRLQSMAARQGKLSGLLGKYGKSIDDVLNARSHTEVGMSEEDFMEVKKLYGGLVDDAGWMQGKLKSGAKATGADELTNDDLKEQQRYLEARKVSPGEALDKFTKMMGFSLSGASTTEVLNVLGKDKGAAIRFSLAVNAMDKLKKAAARLGINTSRMDTAGILKELTSRKGQLTEDEQTALDQAAPLAGMNALNMTGDAVEKAFGTPAGAPGGAAAPVAQAIKLSGKVTLEAPNRIIFQDVDGNMAPMGDADRHTAVI